MTIDPNSQSNYVVDSRVKNIFHIAADEDAVGRRQLGARRDRAFLDRVAGKSEELH